MGATIAARHTASHHGSTGNSSVAVTAPRISVSGMPMNSSRKVTCPRRMTRSTSSRAAWLNRMTVSASWASTVKLPACGLASIRCRPDGPSSMPRAMKISAGATYHRLTRADTTA